MTQVGGAAGAPSDTSYLSILYRFMGVSIKAGRFNLWLVKTLGVLISVIGAVLGMAGVQQSVTREMALLGVGSAAGLTAIEVIYVARRRISRVYLLDAVAELALLIGWSVGSREP